MDLDIKHKTPANFISGYVRPCISCGSGIDHRDLFGFVDLAEFYNGLLDMEAVNGHCLPTLKVAISGHMSFSSLAV
jgi:hypothetical protein